MQHNICNLNCQSNKKETPRDWADLVYGCPWGTFYQAEENFRIIEKQTIATVEYLTADSADCIVGGVAYAIKDGPMGRVVNCLPYYGSYGDALILPGTSPDVEEAIYKKLIERCRSLNVLCLNVITSPLANMDHHEKARTYLKPTFIDERCCQITHLPPYVGESKEGYSEKIQMAIKGRARTAYRKIMKSEFELCRCETEEEALEFARIHKENIGGKGGLYKKESFFVDAFRLSVKNPELAELAIMKDSGRMIAGVVLFYFRDTVEYHTTCLLEEYRSIGPLNRIIIDRMVDAGMAGLRYWNFGGTWKTQEGVYKFKQSFGAVDHPYYYYTVFFRDLDEIRKMKPEELLSAYPNFFVIPFTELT